VTRYRYLSDALAEVINERGSAPPPVMLGGTPIFMRVMHRRGPVRHPHDFTGWSKDTLRGYIGRWHPHPPDLARLNKRGLVRLAEQVRDWRGIESEYPSDQDLVVPLKIWKLEHAFTGARLSSGSSVSVNGDAEG